MHPSLLKYLFIKADYELFEALSAFTLLLFGLGLLNPANNNTWTSAGYKYVSILFTQFELGAFLFVTGVVGLVALKIGGLRFRLAITAFKTLVWMFLFTVFAISDPPRTISPFFVGYVLFNLILLGRQWADYTLGKMLWTDR